MVISCLIVSRHPRQALPVRPTPRVSFVLNSNLQPRISNLCIFYYIRMVIPLDWYVASAYLFYLPLLRKMPGCIPIIPKKELPRPASPLRSLRELSVSAFAEASQRGSLRELSVSALDSSARLSTVSGRVSRIPFTINASKSLSKQTTSTLFLDIDLQRTRGGGSLIVNQNSDQARRRGNVSNYARNEPSCGSLGEHTSHGDRHSRCGLCFHSLDFAVELFLVPCTKNR